MLYLNCLEILIKGKKGTMQVKDESGTIAFMREIFSYMSSSKSTYSLLNSIHESLKSVIYAENFFVVLLNSAEKYVSFPFYKDVIDDISVEQLNQVPLEEIFSTLTFYAIKKKKIVSLTKPDIDKLLQAKEVKVLGTIPEQWICFPLVHKGEFMGNFVVQSYRKTDEYSQQDIEILGFISNVIAAAIYLFNKNVELTDALTELELYKNQLEVKIKLRTSELEETLASLQQEIEKSRKLQEKLAFEAFHDPLTGLYNRKFFTDQLEIYASKVAREPQLIQLAYIDLDGFKAINDTHGHECGDHVLITVAHRLQESFRRHDIVARFGGDEFVVLLTSDIKKKDIEILLLRVIKSVSQSIPFNSLTVAVGISIGIASTKQALEVSSILINKADKALYQAKSQGKGCFVQYDELNPI